MKDPSLNGTANASWTGFVTLGDMVTEVAVWETLYEVVGGKRGSVQLGEGDFNRVFREAGSNIIRRECSGCEGAYKDIYIKVAKPNTWNAYQELLVTWTSDGFKHTFNLYSSLLDALKDTNRWDFCSDADTNIGFPRDCSRDSSSGKGSQWNSLKKGGQKDYKYSVYKQAFAIEVLDNTHKSGIVGQYFNFDWLTVLGAFPKGKVRVRQCRHGAKIWEDYVQIWQNANGGKAGDSHGRRFSGAAPDQWRKGDTLVDTSTNCGDTVPNTLSGYTEISGRGHCMSGYYAGWQSNDARDLATCAEKCSSEAKCRFFVLRIGKTCSRFSSDAGTCQLHEFTTSFNHAAYAKTQAPSTSALSGYTKLPEKGYCKNGYIGGWVKKDARDLATCAEKCSSETKCRFFQFRVGLTCSRYDSRAGTCQAHEFTKSVGDAYAKTQVVPFEVAYTTDSGRYFWGRYFKYDRVGNFATGVYNVRLCRGGASIWAGNIQIWPKHSKHPEGRRDPYPDRRPGDWRKGDVVVDSFEKCPQACPVGYVLEPGDVPGGDQFGGGYGRKADTPALCAAECEKHNDCLSFEYGPSSKKCYLNKVAMPTQRPGKDVAFCVKDVHFLRKQVLTTSELYGIGLGEAADAIFSKADTDGDKAVVGQEYKKLVDGNATSADQIKTLFHTACTSTMEEERYKKLYGIFEHWDRDNSGTVSAQELKAVAYTLNPDGGSSIATKIMTQADNNRDGTITMAELNGWLKCVSSAKLSLVANKMRKVK